MPYSSGRRPFRASPEVSTSGRLKLDFMTGEKTGRLWAEGNGMEASEIQEKILNPIAPFLSSGTAILLPDEGPFDPTEPVSFAFDKTKGWSRRRLFLARNAKDVLRQKYILPAYRKMVKFAKGLF